MAAIEAETDDGADGGVHSGGGRADVHDAPGLRLLLGVLVGESTRHDFAKI